MIVAIFVILTLQLAAAGVAWMYAFQAHRARKILEGKRDPMGLKPHPRPETPTT